MKSLQRLWPIAALMLGAGLLFGLAPQLDLMATRPFAAGGFMLRSDGLAMVLRQIGQWLPVIVVLACLLFFLAPLLAPYRRSRFDMRSVAAILLAFAIGPCLLMNVVLKDHWHRPRPTQIAEFGGTNAFKPWWDTSGACRVNCSFASGEVSAATAAAAVIVLVPAAYTAPALLVALILGAIVAYLRLAFGGHFLSDIVFAALITHFVTTAAMIACHSGYWRYGRSGQLEQDMRLLAFRLHAGAPWLQRQPRWLVRTAHRAMGAPAFSPTLGGVTVVGWEKADELGLVLASPEPGPA